MAVLARRGQALRHRSEDRGLQGGLDRREQLALLEPDVVVQGLSEAPADTGLRFGAADSSSATVLRSSTWSASVRTMSG